MNTNEDYTIIEEISPDEIAKFLEDRIYENNSSLIGKNDGRLFSKTIKDKDSSIIAGIAGWTWANVGEITLLWVKSEYRKKGLGKKLLEEAEKDAKENNCKIIILRSYSFQAPFFYEKHGYKIEYIIDDFPPGNKYYHLIKRI
jgi:ribosomal protein S18 acetylase RimI-like enzyme